MPLGSAGTAGDDVAGAYADALAMTDQAYGQPQDDWSGSADKFLLEPYKQEFLDSVALLREAGLHSIGHLSATGQVINISDDTARIKACLNTSNRDIIDDSGRSMSAGNSHGTLWKYRTVAEMKLVNDRWMLANSTEYRDQPC